MAIAVAVRPFSWVLSENWSRAVAKATGWEVNAMEVRSVGVKGAEKAAAVSSAHSAAEKVQRRNPSMALRQWIVDGNFGAGIYLL